jgi:hypothetical protein
VPKFTKDKAKAIAVEYLTNGLKKELALTNCGYSLSYAKAHGRYLFDRQEVIDEITQLQAKQEVKTNVTRESCVNTLTEIVKDENTTKRDRISALSLIGDFCGFKRDNAVNPEKEAMAKAVMDDEQRKLAEISAKQRIDDVSGGIVVKIA